MLLTPAYCFNPPPLPVIICLLISMSMKSDHKKEFHYNAEDSVGEVLAFDLYMTFRNA